MDTPSSSSSPGEGQSQPATPLTAGANQACVSELQAENEMLKKQLMQLESEQQGEVSEAVKSRDRALTKIRLMENFYRTIGQQPWHFVHERTLGELREAREAAESLRKELDEMTGCRNELSDRNKQQETQIAAKDKSLVDMVEARQKAEDKSGVLNRRLESTLKSLKHMIEQRDEAKKLLKLHTENTSTAVTNNHPGETAAALIQERESHDRTRNALAGALFMVKDARRNHDEYVQLTDKLRKADREEIARLKRVGSHGVCALRLGLLRRKAKVAKMELEKLQKELESSKAACHAVAGKLNVAEKALEASDEECRSLRSDIETVKIELEIALKEAVGERDELRSRLARGAEYLEDLTAAIAERDDCEAALEDAVRQRKRLEDTCEGQKESLREISDALDYCRDSLDKASGRALTAEWRLLEQNYWSPDPAERSSNIDVLPWPLFGWDLYQMAVTFDGVVDFLDSVSDADSSLFLNDRLCRDAYLGIWQPEALSFILTTEVLQAWQSQLDVVRAAVASWTARIDEEDAQREAENAEAPGF
ncbi:hypothetical protein QBC42DRAFT_249403 [Cladorrhinum samala]|uniref:Uncharacterized protein n=1 Tax=Cladorrhinum samala TaxID=585594 RepID=A0AAV9I084_9PEZI|nr:hypothetical protein QBC42DRAFT_249403 [Cladorrhinum samala]